MGMYGPHTDTFTRAEVEPLLYRIRMLEDMVEYEGIQVPEPTVSEARIIRKLAAYAAPMPERKPTPEPAYGGLRGATGQSG